MDELYDELLVDVVALLLPEISLAAASSKYKKAAETAGRLLVTQTYAGCADLTPGAVAPLASWRGLAKCWSANSAWLRASPRDLLIRHEGSSIVATWRDALGRRPSASATLAEGQVPPAGGERASAPTPRRRQPGLVLEGAGCKTGVCIVVATVTGDCTIFDAAHDDAARLELCHGYPSPAADASRPRVALFSPARGGRAAAVHRGRTRSTGAAHVYTVALREAGAAADAESDLAADLYVDAARELADAPLKSSRGFADRMVLGADHLGRWPLRGAIHDFALFGGSLPDAFVRAVERSLAAKHSIGLRPGDDFVDEPEPPAPEEQVFSDDDWSDDEDLEDLEV